MITVVIFAIAAEMSTTPIAHIEAVIAQRAHLGVASLFGTRLSWTMWAYHGTTFTNKPMRCFFKRCILRGQPLILELCYFECLALLLHAGKFLRLIFVSR